MMNSARFRLLFLGAALCVAAGACGPGETPPPPKGGAGGGGGGDPGPARCEELCAHVSEANCFAWSTCAEDCAQRLGASSACAGAADALLECWRQHRQELTCAPAVILPPTACAAEQSAFHACEDGEARSETSECTGQACTTSDETCTCSSVCPPGELRGSCVTRPDGTRQCACKLDKTLLGTCVEPTTTCHNQEGCCAAFFY